MAVQAPPTRHEPSQVEGPPSLSTIPEAPALRRVRRAQWGRRVLLGLFGALLIAGLVGWLGIRTRITEASGDGFDLQVHYPSIARPGVEVPFDVQVHRDGGFTGPITLTVPSSYLSSIDAQSPQPEPTSTTSDGDQVVFKFDAPEGDTFGVSWLSQIDASANMGRKQGTISVLNDDGTPAVAVSIRTWVLP